MKRAAPVGTGRRRHDAGASRRALLDAAGPLFDQRGFDRATTRDIGARAGVEPALITRYFGSKEGLYLAVLDDPERAGTVPLAGVDLEGCLSFLLARWNQRGSSPVTSALAAPDLAPDVAEQLRRILQTRVLRPVEAALAAEGIGADERRADAELAVALIVGITVGRANGTLPALIEFDIDQLVARVRRAVLGGGGRPPPEPNRHARPRERHDR